LYSIVGVIPIRKRDFSFFVEVAQPFYVLFFGTLLMLADFFERIATALFINGG
jgi:hypothetical protein